MLSGGRAGKRGRESIDSVSSDVLRQVCALAMRAPIYAIDARARLARLLQSC